MQFNGLDLETHRAAVANLVEKADKLSPTGNEFYDGDNLDSESDDLTANVEEEASTDTVASLTTYISCLCDSTPSLEQAAAEYFGSHIRQGPLL